MAETFGQVLRRLRIQAGLSKAALAEALGASRMSIIDWEAGKRVPRDRARLEDLAQILRLSARQAEQLAAAHRRHFFAAGQDAHVLTDEPAGANIPPDPLSRPALRHQLRPPIADFVGRARESDYLVAALQAAELACAVVVVDTGVDIRAMLHLLLRRNLVLYDTMRARWRLHDLVRDLARSYLDMAGEQEAVMWRYARAVMQIAQDADEQYFAGADGTWAALARFDVERPHIDMARAWATAHIGTEAGDALLVADALATCHIGGLRYDRRNVLVPQLETALGAAQRTGDRHAEGTVLTRLGRVCVELGEIGRAIKCYEQRRAIAQALGDREGEANAINSLGISYARLGDFRQAISYYEHRCTIAQALGDSGGENNSLLNLGVAYMFLGESWRALTALEAVLARFRVSGARRGEAMALTGLGLAYLDLGEARRALEHFEHAQVLMRALGDRHGEAETLYRIGRATLALGDVARAIECGTHALALLRKMDNQREEGYALRVLGAAYAAGGDRERAQSAFEEALALLHAVGDRWGEAECSWQFGSVLAGWGELERALPFMRAAVTYEQEIGHARAAEHAGVLACSEAGISALVSLRVGHALN